MPNLVSKLTKEQQKNIAIEICEQYRQDVQDRMEWETRRDSFYKLWMCQREPKTTPWKDASNVCLPMLSIAVNQFHGRAYNAIFSQPRLVKAIPVGPNDRSRATRVERYMNWQLRHEMTEYEEETDKLLLNLGISGTVFKKTIFDSEKKRPISQYLPGEDLILPYRTRSLDSARRKTQRIWLHYDELESRNRKNLYANFDKVLKSPQEDETKPPSEDTKDKAEYQTAYQDQRPHLILECHKTFKLGQEYHTFAFTVDYGSQTLLRMVPTEVKGKLLESFTDYHLIPNPRGFYSFGLGHFLQQLNEMGNTAFNQIFDGGRLSNTPFGFYGRRAGIKRREIQLYPGKMNEVEDASQVTFPQMQRLDAVLFQVLGIINQSAEQFSGTSDFLLGRFPRGLKNPTTGSTLGVIEQGLIQFGVLTKRIFRKLQKEYGLIFKLNQLYLPDSKEYRVMESEEDIAFPDVKRDEFDSVHDVIPVGDPNFTSKAQKRQESQELYTLLLQNPLTGFSNPQVQVQNPKMLLEATKDLLESYDRHDLIKYLPKPPEPDLGPDVENSLFMQGDTHEPKPGEDHRLHLSAHEEFKNSPYYKDMPKEYKEIHKKHMQSHRALQFIEAQAQQLLGGANGNQQGRFAGLAEGQPGSTVLEGDQGPQTGSNGNAQVLPTEG